VAVISCKNADSPDGTVFSLVSLPHMQEKVYRPKVKLPTSLAWPILKWTYITRSTELIQSKRYPIINWRSKRIFYRSDIHMSVHGNIIPNYNEQDATFLDLLIFTDALHVSGGSSSHYQEHITVHTASGIANQYCC